jgi:hypothetical protein
MMQGESGVRQWRHGQLTLHLTQSLDTRYLFLMLICCQVSIPFQAKPHNAPVKGVWSLPGAEQNRSAYRSAAAPSKGCQFGFHQLNVSAADAS